MTREEVYKVIDSERNYQNKMSNDANVHYIIPDMHVGDILSAIQYNLDKARTAWYIGSTPHEETMIYLRKIAALCVQSMEKNGCEERLD